MAILDIRQLECFIAIAEEGHMSRAAARLHMTQPPLTRRLNRLERDLGVRLFTRTVSGMELSQPGAVLLERAYRIMQLSQHAVERTRLADTGHIGELVVGYFGSTIFDALPRLLRGFLQANPEVSLTLERAPKNIQAEALRDGRMHVGFSRLFREEPGLRVRHVHSEPLFVAAPPSHPLVNLGQAHVRDLRDEPLVLFPAAPRPSFADEVSQLCLRAGFAVNAVREAEDVVTALAYTAAKGWCAVVPESATTIALAGVQYVPLADGQPQWLSCLHRVDDPAPVLRAFLDYLDVVADKPAGPVTVGTAAVSAGPDT
jgi:DNA-binding transcriptional LysR family regulator